MTDKIQVRYNGVVIDRPFFKYRIDSNNITTDAIYYAAKLSGYDTIGIYKDENSKFCMCSFAELDFEQAFIDIKSNRDKIIDEILNL